MRKFWLPILVCMWIVWSVNLQAKDAILTIDFPEQSEEFELGFEYSPQEIDPDLLKIDKAITYFLKEAPKHPLRHDEKMRERIVRGINRAADISGYGWEVITATVAEESAFRIDARSVVGAEGLMQLYGDIPWEYCEEKQGRQFNKSMLEDNLICGALWLKYGQFDFCEGTMREGMTKYMSSTCDYEIVGEVLQSRVNRRIWLMQKIQEKDL